MCQTLCRALSSHGLLYFTPRPWSLTPHWCQEWNFSVSLTLTRVCSLHWAVHTCLAGRKDQNASSVLGLPLALPWLGIIWAPSLLSLENWAQLGWTLMLKRSRLHLVCSQPSFEPLASCFSRCARLVCPVVLKLLVNFCFRSRAGGGHLSELFKPLL